MAAVIGLKSFKAEHEEFFDLLPESELFAPVLLFYELNNVILNYTKFHQNSVEIKPQRLMEKFNEFEINLIQDQNNQKIFKIAQKYNLTFYDASYIHLLESLSANLFLSFDKDFKKVNDERIFVLK